MEEKNGILSALGSVRIDTKVGVTQSDLTRIGATIFVAACLIMLAWFTFKKLYS